MFLLVKNVLTQTEIGQILQLSKASNSSTAANPIRTTRPSRTFSST